MAPPTIFTRPRRQVQGATGSAFAEVPVSTESELQNAISSIARRAASGILASLGGSICIVAPITITTPIIIPEECPGLTIRAVSRFPIVPSTTAFSTMFDVRAEFVTIRDLFVYGDTTRYFTTFVTVTGTTITGRSADNLRVMHCDFFGDRVYIDTAGDSDDSLLFDVWQTEANLTHDAAVTIDSSSVVVEACHLADGGGDTVTLTAGADTCSIVNNDVGGGDITTSASGGNNVISGNRRTGTITSAGTDAVGLNT